MNAIQINKLTKKFGELVAVNQLDLIIKHGEFFGLLGSNGAGKTTTIKILSGLIKPTSGDATIMSHSLVNDLESVKEITNVSPQETAVAPQLTVKENLELTARIYGLSKSEVERKVEESVKKFRLMEYANKKAKDLSGGWQRKLSIAMALITDPEILFLDEPTIGLDVRARRELWETIKKLKGKTTIILTTHYLEEAEILSDRICIMNNGVVQVLGTAKEIIAKTNSTDLEDAFLKYTEDGEL